MIHRSRWIARLQGSFPKNVGGPYVTVVRDRLHCERALPRVLSDPEAVMAVPMSKLTPFERVLFTFAVLIGLVAFALRFGTAATLWIVHHVR